MTTAEEVVAAVAPRAYRFADERDLHELLADVLAPLGEVRREVSVSGGRVDLAIDRIGIEVKVAGTPAAVGRQLARYRDCGAFDGVVLITTRPAHLSLSDPTGVPVRVVVLTGGAF